MDEKLIGAVANAVAPGIYEGDPMIRQFAETLAEKHIRATLAHLRENMTEEAVLVAYTAFKANDDEMVLQSMIEALTAYLDYVEGK